MFAACMLFALPAIKDAWIASDTHPVYNKRVKPSDLFRFSTSPPNLNPQENQPNPLIDLREQGIPLPKKEDMLAIEKHKAVSECAYDREQIEYYQDLLKKENAKPTRDPKTIVAIQQTIALHRESSKKYAGLLEKHPELEKQIEELRLKWKQK